MSHLAAEQRAQAEKIACAYHTPRYKKLDRLERYAKGTQYEGRSSWWNNEVPLQERAPCLRAPIAERAIRSHKDLCLGEGRFPRITTHVSEDDKAFDSDLGLSETESKLYDRFVQCIVDQTRLPEVSKDAITNGLECGTTVAIARIDDEQKLVVDVEQAKHCTPELYPSGKVKKLEIRYPYIVDVEKKQPGQPTVWTCECRIYRRVIDEQTDTTYLPAKASETGGEPDAWIPDPEQTFAHGLGFVPAIWWRRGRKRTTKAEIDGIAIHETLLDEIDGLNFSLSQRHRAARYAGDPQIVEYGVASEDDVKAPRGREAKNVQAGADDHPSNRSYRVYDSSNKQSRRKGPGAIWTYTDPQASCEYLVLPAGALDSLVGDIRELYAMIRDALGYVDSDPANIKIGGDVSGKTLEWLYTNAINFCNDLRPDFADGFLLPLVSLLLRLVSTKHKSGETLSIPGFTKVAPLAAKFDVDGKWQPPEMTCVWGAYFPLSEGDKKAKQERVLAGFESGVLTEQTVVEELATMYPSIKDPAAYLKTVQKEKQAKMARVHDAKAALVAAGEVQEVGEQESGNEGLPAQPEQMAGDKKQVLTKAPKKTPNFRAKKPIGEKPESIPVKGKGRREVVRTRARPA
jgi:hypothetical protein